MKKYHEQFRNIETSITFPKINESHFETILLEVVNYIISKKNPEWAITRRGNIIRLHFGSFIIFSIEQNNIWLSIDISNADKLENISFWRWDKKDYPEYKKGGLFSKNGYFNGSYKDWNVLRPHHYDYINKINSKGHILNARTRKNHDESLLFFLTAKQERELTTVNNLYIDEVQIEEIESQSKLLDFSKINSTERSVIIKNRIGQNIFRENLLRKYKQCLICGIVNPVLLRASHIKSWKEAIGGERLSPNNGLLLCANHDALFDNFLISFNDDGEILISRKIKLMLKELSLKENLKINMNDEMKLFMKWHRENFYKNNYIRI